MQETTLEIGGMTCDGCVRAVERRLKSLPGVKGVRVDLKGNQAEVKHEPATLPADLAAAVGKLGYTALVK
jgi:copper chaperone CopZ